jgi:hypothetical protein
MAVERRRPKGWFHYLLPDGTMVRLIRWMRDEDNVFVARVAVEGGKKPENYLGDWFHENAVHIGRMPRQF